MFSYLMCNTKQLILFISFLQLQGPTGQGADLGGMGGGAASLEHEPTTIRKLLFSNGKLYAGDVMGSLCRCEV